MLLKSTRMSHIMRKPVFWGLRPGKTKKCISCIWQSIKPACSATETSLEIMDLASICIILSRQRTIKALQTAWMSRLICAFVVHIWHRQVFSWGGSNNETHLWWPPVTWARGLGDSHRSAVPGLYLDLIKLLCHFYKETKQLKLNRTSFVLPWKTVSKGYY